MKKIIILVVVLVVAAFVLLGKDSATKVITELGDGNDPSVITKISLLPESPKAEEEVEITLSFLDSENSPLTDLMTHHARKVHVLVLSKNLGYIAHVHPDDFPELQGGLDSGEHKIKLTFPVPGEYILGTDIMSSQGSYSKQFLISVSGQNSEVVSLNKNLDKEKCFVGFAEQGANDRYVDFVSFSDSRTECKKDSYKVSMSVEGGRAGETTKLRFNISKGGEPVVDLEPFLDQEIHLAIVPDSLDNVLHRHGTAVVPEGFHVMSDGTVMMDSEMKMDMKKEESMEASMEAMGHDQIDSHSHGQAVPRSFGPYLVSESLNFSQPGIYKVVGQIKHRGHIFFPDFFFGVK